MANHTPPPTPGYPRIQTSKSVGTREEYKKMNNVLKTSYIGMLGKG